MILPKSGGNLWMAPLYTSSGVLLNVVFFVLNLFHGNIKFTYEQEKKNKLPFLDVLFIRDYENINITVFRKNTHNDLYLHWDLFLPISWK